MSQVRIKLVNGATYGCPSFPGENKTLRRGDSVVVDKALADKLLEDKYVDRAGKDCLYFEEVDMQDDASAEGDESGGETQGSQTRRTAPVKTVARKR